MDFPINLFNKQILKDEYITRSEIIYNLSIHIENLNNECIIHHSLRSKYSSHLNSIVKELNDEYNSNIRNIKNDDLSIENSGFNYFSDSSLIYKYFNQIYFSFLDIILKKLDMNNNKVSIDFLKTSICERDQKTIECIEQHIGLLYEDCYYILNDIKNLESENFNEIKKNFKLYIFQEIDKKIIKLFNLIGSNNVEDVIKLKMGKRYEKLVNEKNFSKVNNYLEPYHKDKTSNLELKKLNNKIENSYILFDLLNKSFKSIKILIKSNDNGKGIKIEKKHKEERKNLKEDSNYFKYEVLLDNIYKVSIKFNNPNLCFILIGYFNYDSVNVLVRTSKIKYYFLNVKNSLINKMIENDLKKIDDTFKTVYSKNLQIGDILSLNEKNLKTEIMNDFEKYSDYVCTRFRTLMSDFLKVNLDKKYNILKMLLMGNKDSIKCAGLLYALTKDQFRDNKNNYTLLSNILYKNLNFPLQSKLKKSGYYIKDELEKLKEMSYEDVDLKKQVIISMTMPESIKKIALSKIDEMKNNNSEYYKYFQYVKCLIDYPWINDNEYDLFKSLSNSNTKSKDFIVEMEERLNNIVYGHEDSKNSIKELIGKWISNNKSMGKAIGLCGPPGVGKTLLAKGLGDVLKIPFTQINIGGMDDASVLCGHSITYSGAQYGLIVRKMCESGKSRTIMFFDELDKSCTRHGVNEITNVLIHATDPNTNSEFNDKYFQEIQFPLSNVLFVFSFNDKSKVDKILLDRMEIINVHPYSTNDKIKIVNKFLLNEILDSFGFEKYSIKMSEELIIKLIEEHTHEAGVRDLKRKLDKICSKLNLDKIYSNSPFDKIEYFSKENPIQITEEMISKYLGKNDLNIKMIHKSNEIGIISGLYATTIGTGGIIPILMYPNFLSMSNFNLRLTGSQGKVMKESVLYSYTVAINCINFKYRNLFLKNPKYKFGIHIHTPDGATPKDGPSAGAAFTTSFISVILQKKIKNQIAMTGEIEINGKITQIGGLEYKLIGAKKAGIKLVFVTIENKDDLKKIVKKNKEFLELWDINKKDYILDFIKELKEDPEIKFENNENEFKVLIVENVRDVINYALIDNDNDNLFEQTFDNEKYTTDIIGNNCYDIDNIESIIKNDSTDKNDSMINEIESDDESKEDEDLESISNEDSES